MDTPKPKISINKLGEYLTATPSRRKQIIEDQKYPSSFKVARYTRAREIIVNFIASGMEDDSLALIEAEKILLDAPKSPFDEQDRILSARAIEDFIDICDEIDINKCFIEEGYIFAKRNLEMAGVSISIRPDAIIKDSESGKIVGAVKLHFSRTTPLEEKGCEYVATAMRSYLEGYASNAADIKNNKCYVVDVSTGKVKTAPRSFKRRMNDIKAACEEINVRWNTV